MPLLKLELELVLVIVIVLTAIVVFERLDWVVELDAAAAGDVAAALAPHSSIKQSDRDAVMEICK